MAETKADKPLSHDVMAKAVKTYYSLVGWDADGVPLPEKLA